MTNNLPKQLLKQQCVSFNAVGKAESYDLPPEKQPNDKNEKTLQQTSILRGKYFFAVILIFLACNALVFTLDYPSDSNLNMTVWTLLSPTVAQTQIHQQSSQLAGGIQIRQSLESSRRYGNSLDSVQQRIYLNSKMSLDGYSAELLNQVQSSDTPQNSTLFVFEQNSITVNITKNIEDCPQCLRQRQEFNESNIDIAKSLLQLCSNQASYMSTGKKIRLVASPDGHSKPFLLCKIPKVGSSQWARMQLRISGSPYLLSQNEIHKQKYPYHLCKLGIKQQIQLLNEPYIPRLMLVRNPYARLVSAFLDKVAHDKPYANSGRFYQLSRKLPIRPARLHAPEYTRRIFLSRMMQLTTNTTFEQYVQLLFDLYSWQGDISTHNGFNHHLTLQSQTCGRGQGLQYDLVYKLENINHWYPRFISQFNIQRDMSTGWPGAGNCFLSTDAQPCDGPRALVDANGGVSFEETQAVLGVEKYQHSTNATSKVLAMLKPAVVQQINIMYKKDFEAFGYKMWDGIDPAYLVMN